MRTILADCIFPVSSMPVKKGGVVVDDNGVIQDVIVSLDSVDYSTAEIYEGIIVPGFVNAHCHLELSHMKGVIEQGKGLGGFISELVSLREKFTENQIKSAINAAEEEMFLKGIVAVGDISNTEYTFEKKKNGKIAYHTFLEVFDLTGEKANDKISEALRLQAKINLPDSSITPHSPYSVSAKLLAAIDSLQQSFLSIHNQESALENELFLSGTGLLADVMRRSGADVYAKQKHRNPLLFILGQLMETKKVLLVHNTFTSQEDIEIIRSFMEGGECEIALCLCPCANLYIENRLPNIPMLVKSGLKIMLGTDSFASNNHLSILEEMKTIAKHFPEISFENLLMWATKNGAEFFEMQEKLGTIEKGKKPGLNLLSGISSDSGWQLTESVSVRKLV